METVPSHSPVTEDAHCEYYYNTLCRLWGLTPRSTRHNPCPLPVPLTAAHLAASSPDDYYVTPKVDGVRHLLMLCMDPTGRHHTAVMIDRAMGISEVEVWAGHTFFEQGTLIDGELTWVGEQLQYFAFDIMCVEGRPVHRQPLPSRLGHLRQVLELSESHVRWIDRYHVEASSELLSFVPEEGKIVATRNNLGDLALHAKHMLPASAWAADPERCWELPTSRAETDGLVLTPVALPVYVNAHRRMFKWKPRSHQTVDVLVEGGTAYAQGEGGEMVDAATLGLRLSAEAEEVDRGVYECGVVIDDTGVRLAPRVRRTDKTRPNSTETVVATIECARSALSIEHVVGWAKKMDVAIGAQSSLTA